MVFDRRGQSYQVLEPIHHRRLELSFSFSFPMIEGLKILNPSDCEVKYC